MSQPQELGLRAQVLDVVPPGPIHRNRRSAVAKFSHRIPNFRDPGSTFNLVPDPRAGAIVDLAAKKKEETVSRLRASAQQQQQRGGPDVKVPLLLEQRDAAGSGSAPPAAVFKGVPEAGGGANMEGPPLHYVLFRSGNRVTAFPAEQWFAFKPHVDRRGLLDSVAAANAAAIGAAGRQPASGRDKDKDRAAADPFALRLVPKSQRMEKQRQDEEAKERQEQVAAGRLLPLAGAVEDELGRGGRLKRFVDEDELEEELFGNDDEDEAPRFGGKGGKRGRGRGLKTADGEELGEDEVPEDLYAGPAADEDLRPEKPEEAEDWEHEFAPDDDDQDQGQDEVYDDDPGMRKKLGIEADEEDEGEEADEQARKLKKLGDPDDSDQEEEEQKKKEEEEAKRQQAAAAGAPGRGTAAGGEEDEPGEEDEDELDELEEMEDEPKPPPPRPAAPPSATAKPPPAPGGAAAAAAAGSKRKVAEEASRPGAEGAKRARTATPPPAVAAAAAAGGAARAATPGAGSAQGAGTAAASQQQQQQRAGGAAAATPGGTPAAAATAGGGGIGGGCGPAVTAEEVVELLRRQPNGIMPFQDFTRHFARRTTTPELRAGLKSLTVSLCKSSKNEAGQLLVSLKK